MAVLIWTLLAAAGLTAWGCDGREFATEAQVLALLDEPESAAEREALADTGRRLFITQSCKTCHVVEGPARGAPRLRNLYRTRAVLRDGTELERSRAYLVQSILNPAAVVVAGYPQPMATYGHLPAEEVAALVAYLERFSPPPVEKDTAEPTAGGNAADNEAAGPRE